MPKEPGGPNFGEVVPQEVKEIEKKPQEVKDAVDFEDPKLGLYKILIEKRTIAGQSEMALIKAIQRIRKSQKEGKEIKLDDIAVDESGENNLREKVIELLAVEEGIKKAMDLLKERFENPNDKENMLAFHNREHTEGVIRRVKTILLAIKEADPNLVSGRDVALGTLIAAWHDVVQNFIKEETTEEKGEFKGYKKVKRKRAGLGNKLSNEQLSYLALEPFMDGVYDEKGKERIFNKDLKTAEYSIEGTTLAGWNGKTVTQKSTQRKTGDEQEVSMIEVALALADVGVSGMDGPEKYEEDGKRLFREDHLDIMDEINSVGINKIPKDKKEYFKQRMIGWLKEQITFPEGRENLLDSNLEPIPSPSARQAVKNLFNKFEDSINSAKKIAVECEKMTFEELAKYMGY